MGIEDLRVHQQSRNQTLQEEEPLQKTSQPSSNRENSHRPPLDKLLASHNDDLNQTSITRFETRFDHPVTMKKPVDENERFRFLYASDPKFAEKAIAVHRKERNYTWPEEKTRIKQIVTLYYKQSLNHKAADKKPTFISSNFVVISSPTPNTPCVVYQNMQEIERTDFSYTCNDNGKIIHIFLIRNSQLSNEKENSILLVMYKHKKKELDASEKLTTSFASIATDKMKLKPLFQLAGSLHQQGSKQVAVSQRDNSKFRLVVLVEPLKILYARTKAASDWFTQLKDNHYMLLLETHQIKPLDKEVLSVVFDASDFTPTRLMISISSSDDNRFFIWREKSDPNEVKLLPEFQLSVPSFEKISRNDIDSRLPYSEAPFFSSRLSVIGIGALFKGSSENSVRVKVAIFDCSASKLESEDTEDSNKFKPITLKSSSSESPADLLVEMGFQHRNMIEGFSSELRMAHTELMHLGNRILLIAFGVTGTDVVFWLIVRRNIASSIGSTLITKLVEVNLEPGDLNLSKSQTAKQNSNYNYLNALGQYIFIDETTQDKPKARVGVSFGKINSSELEFDLENYLK
jgi:hypothetical protein